MAFDSRYTTGSASCSQACPLKHKLHSILQEAQGLSIQSKIIALSSSSCMLTILFASPLQYMIMLNTAPFNISARRVSQTSFNARLTYISFCSY